MLKALYAFINNEEESLIPAQKKMLFSVNKSYELYHMLLRLVVDLADYTREMDEKRSLRHLATEDEKNPSYRLANNSLINVIRNSEELNYYLKKNKLSWGKDNDLFKQLYTRLTEADYYKEYIAKESVTFIDDRKVIVDFLRKEIEDNELFYSVVEEMSIFWIDEIEFFTSKVASQLSKTKEGCDLELAPLWGSDDDIEFARDIFSYSILQYEDNVEIIKNYAKNWDVERITVMDRLIIIMAIAELVKISNIPTSVTLDEYIELAKSFSTNNSNVFINGILHKYIIENNITK